MHLTGWPDGPPLLEGWPALAAASEVAELVEDLARRRRRSVMVDAAEVLFGRAASAGLQRAGRTSAGGSCRLLEAMDGWLAAPPASLRAALEAWTCQRGITCD